MNTQELMKLLEERRTYRRFDESRPIPDEVVEDMKRSAYLSSSAMNRQPLRYIYVRTSETVNAIFDITSWGGALPDGLGRPKVGERPTMFVVVLSVRELESRFTDYDAGLATSNLTLSAFAHGVGSCILGSVRVDELCSLLNISDEFRVVTAIGFGYPTHKSRVEDADESIKYYLDENLDYVVPKRRTEDTVTEI